MTNGIQKKPDPKHVELAGQFTRQLAARITRERSRVEKAGLGDDLFKRAQYIVGNKLKAAGVPIWAVELLMEGVEQALRTLLDQTEPAVLPPVES